jgi:midasin
VELLRNFHDTDEVGVRLLSSLTFEQKKTDLIQMLDTMSRHFAEGRLVSTPSNQLLIVIGDGRGALSQGASLIKSSIGRLMDEGVVVLYLIVDNPQSSVFKIKSYSNGKLVDYMDQFVFPFYTAVQSVGVIPVAISEAVRQYFDLMQEH